MSENVYIPERNGQFSVSWPNRCVYCGRKKETERKLDVVHTTYQSTNIFTPTKTITHRTVLAIPYCREHANLVSLTQRVLSITTLAGAVLFTYLAYLVLSNESIVGAYNSTDSRRGIIALGIGVIAGLVTAAMAKNLLGLVFPSLRIVPFDVLFNIDRTLGINVQYIPNQHYIEFDFQNKEIREQFAMMNETIRPSEILQVSPGIQSQNPPSDFGKMLNANEVGAKPDLTVGRRPDAVSIAYLDALRRGDPPGAVALLSNFGLSVTGATREEIQEEIAKLLVDWRLLDYQITDVRHLADETALVLITGGSCGADNVRAPFQQWLALHFEEGQWRVNNDDVVDGNWLTIEPQVINQVSVQPVSFTRYLGKMRVYLDVANLNEHIVVWGEEKAPGAKCYFPNQTEELLINVQMQPKSRQRYYLDFSGWFSDFPVAIEFLQWKSAADVFTRSKVWSYRFEMQAPQQEANNAATEGLAVLLRHHIERNREKAPELSAFFEQYFSNAEIATLAVIAGDKLALTQADGQQHSFGFSNAPIYYHISIVPVDLDRAREWFDRDFGGYTNLLWKLMSSELMWQCSIFCHIVYGWTQQNGTWVHMAVCRLNDAASISGGILPIELLSPKERRELGL